MRVFEAFAGYGSQSMALKRANIDFEVVGISEIDKYAIVAYEAIHGKTKNFGDISKINERELPDFDLFTYSFPCSDISLSGKQLGINKDTRSGLLWECEQIISYKLPKYLLMENVKNLVGKKFKPDFDKWCEFLEGLGYENHWQVVNAKEHGVPQNRERVFMVSIFGGGEYEFPEKEELNTFLIDITEDEVDEKYYLRPEQYSNLIKNLPNLNTNPSGRGMNGKVHVGDIAPTLTTNKGEGVKFVVGAAVRGRNPENPTSRVSGLPTKQMLESDGNEWSNCLTTVQKDSLVLVKEATKKGYKEAKVGDSINLEQPNSKTRRGRVGDQVAQTLNTGCNQAVVEKKILRYERTEYGKKIRKDYESGKLDEKIGNMRVPVPREDGISNTLTTVQKDNHLLDGLRVRKLTPKEAFRLMDVSDEDFFKAQKALNETFYKGKNRSSSQLYKLAGNSIVVRPLMKIFENLNLPLKTPSPNDN